MAWIVEYFTFVPIIEIALILSWYLILSTKLESSKSEIKRLIKNSGIKINNLKIEKDLPVSKIILENKNYFKLSIGKKKHYKIEIN